MPKVRVVGADGAQIGIIDTDEALRMAAEADLIILAAPVRANAMLISSESASVWRSVSFTRSSFRESCLDGRNHLFRYKWFMDEAKCARFIGHRTCRTLDISTGYYD